ncbi:MAG TPA: carboxymuconolactone decarboxylase family protein [Ilumatobacteraceae bacterium]|nr:carboxymuconolactone decarboxylase family protein [Ilumatobacteraceae bacterium]
MPHLDPVDADTDDPVLRNVFDVFVDSGRDVPMLYRLLGNSPDMLAAWVGLAWPLRAQPTTSRALRELIIMRIAVLTQASYEWSAHWPAALKAGVTTPQLRALGIGAASDEFDAAQRATLRCTDEIILDGGASASAMAELRMHFSDGECVELVLTATFYACVSRTLASLGLEADAPPDEPSRAMFDAIVESMPSR